MKEESLHKLLEIVRKWKCASYSGPRKPIAGKLGTTQSFIVKAQIDFCIYIVVQAPPWIEGITETRPMIYHKEGRASAP